MMCVNIIPNEVGDVYNCKHLIYFTITFSNLFSSFFIIGIILLTSTFEFHTTKLNKSTQLLTVNYREKLK